MTMHNHPRLAATAKLTSLALDLSEHRGDAATSLMTAAATILNHDFGGDETARLMHQLTGEALLAWETAKATAAHTTLN